MAEQGVGFARPTANATSGFLPKRQFLLNDNRSAGQVLERIDVREPLSSLLHWDLQRSAKVTYSHRTLRAGKLPTRSLFRGTHSDRLYPLGAKDSASFIPHSTC